MQFHLIYFPLNMKTGVLNTTKSYCNKIIKPKCIVIKLLYKLTWESLC